jgi:hypothetical protein
MTTTQTRTWSLSSKTFEKPGRASQPNVCLPESAAGTPTSTCRVPPKIKDYIGAPLTQSTCFTTWSILLHPWSGMALPEGQSLFSRTLVGLRDHRRSTGDHLGSMSLQIGSLPLPCKRKGQNSASASCPITSSSFSALLARLRCPVAGQPTSRMDICSIRPLMTSDRDGISSCSSTTYSTRTTSSILAFSTEFAWSGRCSTSTSPVVCRPPLLLPRHNQVAGRT